MDDRERMRRMGELAYLIYREWWRPLRNRSRRKEVRALWAEAERDRLSRAFQEAIRRPVSPSAEAEHVLRVRNFLDSLPDASGTFTGYLADPDQPHGAE